MSADLSAMRPDSTRAGGGLEAQHHGIIVSLIQLLGQLTQTLDAMTDEQYTRKPVGVIESSVGAHVRHCLDHVQSLLRAFETGELNYDCRRRGTLIESQRKAALKLIGELMAALEALPSEFVSRTLSVSMSIATDGEPARVKSSVARETAYVLSHTIHHNAIIRTMIKTMDGWIPEHFGYAPSTIRNLEKERCAPSASCACRGR